MDFLGNLFDSFLYLAAVGTICIILQKLFPSISEQKLWRKETSLDLTYWLFINIFVGYLTMFLAGTILTLVALLLSPALLERINSPDQSSLFIAGVFLSLVLLDFTAYWIHRLFHVSGLWNYHALHHSSPELDWLSSVRFHPLEAVIIISVTYSICIISGLGFKEVTLALAIRSAYGYMVHANLSWGFGPLGYIFASPRFHRWHHSKEKAAIDKNFAGVFSLWDYIFGTAYCPRGIQPHNFGVRENLGKNIWQHILYPFNANKNKLRSSNHKLQKIG